MRFGDRFHHGKTHPQTAGTRRNRPAGLSEEVEDMWQERAGYAQTIVLDGHHKVLPVCEHVHGDATFFRRVFHRVVQEVADGLCETHRIAFNA
nr:hypothetical protein [Paraburkholderia phytofirmans]